MTRSKQKFRRGDLVYVSKPTCSTRRHFDGNKQALISASYADDYGCGIFTNYGVIFLDEHGKPDYYAAWYSDSDLRLIKKRTLASIEIVEDYLRHDTDDEDWHYRAGDR